MDTPIDLREMLRIFWFRKWTFLLPAALFVVAAVAVAFVLPPLYRSQATILIEQQDIPEDVVPSLINEQIDRRLQVLTQQVLTTSNLLRIADRYELYADERDELTPNAVAAKMRERIETEKVLTEVNNPRTGRTGQATLAFQIRFRDGDPHKARQVTNALISDYMAMNQQNRRAVAEQATGFLGRERRSLDKRIAAIEYELADFQKEHRELLPEEAALKRRMLNNFDEQLRSFENDLRVLRERKSFLSTQLALTDEFEAAGIGRWETPESRLELLRADLASARARYQSNHPDVVRLEREVRSLQQVVGARAGTSALAEREAALSAELASLRERYTGEHPDVQRVRRELAALRDRIEAAGDADAGTSGVERNPTYVQLSAQLNSVQAEIASIEDQRAELRQERLALQEALARAPEVEREYNRIVRRLDNALADREELADKEATARLSGSLEAAAGGERLSLIETPQTPLAPHSPNKKLILAIGVVLGVGSGGVSLVLAELLDRSIRSARDLVRILGDQPLAAIPTLTTFRDIRRRWLRRLGAVAGVAIVATGGLIWVHQQVVPLDVLGYQSAGYVERWLGTTPAGAGDAAASRP